MFDFKYIPRSKHKKKHDQTWKITKYIIKSAIYICQYILTINLMTLDSSGIRSSTSSNTKRKGCTSSISCINRIIQIYSGGNT